MEKSFHINRNKLSLHKMTELVSRHDIVYDEPGCTWTDGLPLGNGDMGALAYAPFFPEWIVNKVDIWDYREPSFPKKRTIAEIRRMLAQGKGVRDLQDETPRDLADYPQPKTCGIVRLRVGEDMLWSPPCRITQRLHLLTATLEETLDKHLCHPRVTSFITPGENVLVIRVRNVSAYVNAVNHLDIFRDRDALVGEPKVGGKDDRVWLDMTLPDGLRYVMMAKVVPLGRYAYCDWMKRNFRKGFRVPGLRPVKTGVEGHITSAEVGGDFDAFITVVTSLESKNPFQTAVRRLEDVAQKGAEHLHRRHAAWWRRFWMQSAVSLGDPFLEGWWYASLYASRSTLGKTPAPGLCGLWYGPNGRGRQDLPWRGFYTHDYNMQISGAAMPVVGHPELVMPYIETLYRALPMVKAEARKRYGVEGAIYPLGSGPNCREASSPLYRHCEQACNAFWGAILAGWDAVLQDRRLLRERIYPIVREIALFYVNYMQLDPKSRRYRLWPTQPAEFFYLDKANPTTTLMLIKRTILFARDAAQRLKVDGALQQRWRDLIERFPEYPTDRGVLTIAEGLPREHYNFIFPAWMLWPAGALRPDSPTSLRRAVERTLDYHHLRQLRSWAQRHGAHEGSFGMATTMALCELRIGNIPEAWRIFIENSMRLFPKPNGLIAHNASLWCESAASEANLRNIPDIKLLDGGDWMPLIEPGAQGQGCTEHRRHREYSAPVIEGNGGYLLFMSEMLLQSWAGQVEIFPGFRRGGADFDAAFAGLLAEGGFAVSARRVRGQTEFVHVRSRAGGLLRLVNPWPGHPISCLVNSRPAAIRRGDMIEIETRRGQQLMFWPSGRRSPSAIFQPFDRSRPGPRAVRYTDGNVVWYGKPEMRKYLDLNPPAAPVWPAHGLPRRRRRGK